jgi:hypothetical protein
MERGSGALYRRKGESIKAGVRANLKLIDRRCLRTRYRREFR